MKTDEKLALELVWEPDGHLSEVAATVAADGQEQLLPSAAVEHLSECESCMRRVGDAAMLSLRVDEQVNLVHRERRSLAEPRVMRARLPVPALVVALTLAALGALPALSAAPVRIAQLSSDIIGVAPHAVRGILALARAGTAAVGPALWGASMLSVLVLFLAGLAIARTMPRRSLARAANRGGG